MKFKLPLCTKLGRAWRRGFDGLACRRVCRVRRPIRTGLICRPIGFCLALAPTATLHKNYKIYPWIALLYKLRNSLVI